MRRLILTNFLWGLSKMMKKVKLSEISKTQIWTLEEEVQKIAKEVREKFQPIFQLNSYNLLITFSRNNVNPKNFPNYPEVTKEQCLEPYYCSSVGVTVTDIDGNLIGNEDDGYLFGEGLTIWEVEKTFLFFSIDEFPLSSTKGFLLALSPSEIKKELEHDVFFLAKELNIQI
jgi:hypothetical protein